MSKWHFVEGSSSCGPFTPDQIGAFIASGRVTAQTLVWHDGMPQWEPAALYFEGFSGAEAPMSNGLYAGAPARGFAEATAVCLRKYMTFRGRASRSEYWFFVLFSFLAGAIASFFDLLIFGFTNTLSILNGLTSLALLLPSTAVAVRRLHDTGRSGWWIGGFYLVLAGLSGIMAVVLASAPLAGDAAVGLMMGLFMLMGLGMLIYAIVMLVFFCLRGTPGENRFG